jgi:hypothetical protein
MARTLSWTAADEDYPTDWSDEHNWLDEATQQAPAYCPEGGDTLQYIHGALSMPDENFPYGGYYDVVISDHDGAPWEGSYLSEFVGWDCDGVGTVTIGDATHHNEEVTIDYECNVVVWGTVYPAANFGTVLINNGGTLVAENAYYGVSFLTVGTGGTLTGTAITFVVNELVLDGGTLTGNTAPFVIDMLTPVVVTKNSTIDSANGALSGHAITYANLPTGATRFTFYLDAVGVFDPGGNIDQVAVEIHTARTLLADLSAYSVYVGANGALAMDGHTVTVGNGGIYFSGYCTGLGRVTVPAGVVTTNFLIGPSTASPGTADGVNVTIDGTVTQVGQSNFMKLSGSGVLNMGNHWFGFGGASDQTLLDNFFDFTGTVSGATSKTVFVYPRTTSLRNSRKITLPCFLYVYVTKTGGGTLYATGGISADTLQVSGNSTGGALDMDGGDLTVAGATTIGTLTATGKIIMRAGKHSLGVVSMAAGAAATSGITYGGTVLLIDDHTLSGLVTTLTNASLVIAAGKALKGASARTPTSAGAHAHGGAVTNLALTAANPLYRFGDTSGDTGNGVGVIKCPAPASPSCMPMAA